MKKWVWCFLLFLSGYVYATEYYVTAPVYSGHSVVPNGEFSRWTTTTQPENWTITLGGTATVAIDSSFRASLPYCIKFRTDTSGNACSISQQIVLAANTQYEASFYSRNNSVTGTNLFKISITYNDGSLKYLRSDNTWGNYDADISFATTFAIVMARNSVIFTTPNYSGNYTISVGNVAGTNIDKYIYFDNISVRPFVSGGNDNNAGTAWETAWSSFNKVQRVAFSPGDVINLRGVFRETLYSSASGTSTGYITYRGAAGAQIRGDVERTSGWKEIATNQYAYLKTNRDSLYTIYVGLLNGKREMLQSRLDTNGEFRVALDTLIVYLTNPADTARVNITGRMGVNSGVYNYNCFENLHVTLCYNYGFPCIYLVSGRYNIIRKCRADSTQTPINLNASQSILENSIIEGNVYMRSDSSKVWHNQLIIRPIPWVDLYSSNVNLVDYPTHTGGVVKNNIMYNLDDNGDSDFITDASVGEYDISNNLFYAPSSPTGQYRGTGETSPLIAEPAFIDTTNGEWRPSALSPVWGNGARIIGYTEDRDGTPLVDKWWGYFSRGAYGRYIPHQYRDNRK